MRFLVPGFDGRPYVLTINPVLIETILKMPPGKPIRVDAAWMLFSEEFQTLLFDLDRPDLAYQFQNQDWIKWIRDQGYQIVLS